MVIGSHGLVFEKNMEEKRDNCMGLDQGLMDNR